MTVIQTQDTVDIDQVVSQMIAQQAEVGIYLAVLRKYAAYLIDAHTVIKTLRDGVATKPYYQYFLQNLDGVTHDQPNHSIPRP